MRAIIGTAESFAWLTCMTNDLGNINCGIECDNSTHGTKKKCTCTDMEFYCSLICSCMITNWVRYKIHLETIFPIVIMIMIKKTVGAVGGAKVLAAFNLTRNTTTVSIVQMTDSRDRQNGGRPKKC